MSVHKSVQADRDAPQAQRQAGETDIEQTPLKLRNADLARPASPGHGRPLRPDEVSPGGGETAAANGHWLHDAAGPASYVGPQAETLAGVSVPELIARVEERLGYLHDLDASRIHVSVAEGSVILSGQVESLEARRRAGACAVATAQAVPVQNRLVVDR